MLSGSSCQPSSDCRRRLPGRQRSTDRFCCLLVSYSPLADWFHACGFRATRDHTAARTCSQRSPPQRRSTASRNSLRERPGSRLASHKPAMEAAEAAAAETMQAIDAAAAAAEAMVALERHPDEPLDCIRRRRPESLKS